LRKREEWFDGLCQKEGAVEQHGGQCCLALIFTRGRGASQKIELACNAAAVRGEWERFPRAYWEKGRDREAARGCGLLTVRGEVSAHLT